MAARKVSRRSGVGRAVFTRLGVLAVASLAAASVLLAQPAAGISLPRWVVSLGDSYISGEAGRWAGNADNSARTDALGSTAYYDTSTGEAIRGCHRSKSAEIIIGSAYSANLACSGAASATVPYSTGSDFKPGLDFYDDGHGHVGQALALRTFAAAHRVAMVAVSIGGNDFAFASIVQTCVEDFLLSPIWWQNHCNDDSSVTARFSAAAVSNAVTAIATGLGNIREAMSEDGYPETSYSILVQTYPSPLPDGSGDRYSEAGYTRQMTGGCGFWNADLDWANGTALPTINLAVRTAVARVAADDIAILDVSSLFDGHRLCEKSDHKLQETGYSSWQQPGASDASEWIENIRTVTAALTPYYVQESLHPNYWGQLALRNCLRQAYDNGAPHGGTCTTSGTGLTAVGEPRTQLS